MDIFDKARGESSVFLVDRMREAWQYIFEIGEKSMECCNHMPMNMFYFGYYYWFFGPVGSRLEGGRVSSS
jgi:hypothetical protein